MTRDIPDETFLHVDINSYFATLAQQETPALRGKPVGIIKDVGRTCIIAASKEAKQFGIKTGERLKDARQKCPDIITVPAQFDMYLSATKDLRRVFASLAPDVEVFSLDESFINFTPLRKLYPSPQEFGYELQTQIKKTLGEWVTCNVGISYNRFLAKMSGEVSPKGSITEVTPLNRDALLARVAFSDVCGIGMRLERKLRLLNVTTPFQINFIETEVLLSLFGPFWTKELQKMARGDEPLFLTRIDQNPHMKSVSRSITLFSLSKEQDHIKRVLYNLATEVMHKVRRMDLAGRVIGVYLRGDGPNSWGTYVTLRRHINHLSEYFDILWNQLISQWNDHFPVIKFVVYLGLLEPMQQVPQPILPDYWKQERVARAVDSLSKKYGLFTVRSGLFLNQEIIKPEVTGYLGDKLYQFMD
ncbi:MAG: hypothetical protein WAU07_00780 [Microgenomates group bacterium]